MLRLSRAKKEQSTQSLVEAAWRAFNLGHDKAALEYAAQAASATNDVDVRLELHMLAEDGVKRACQQHFPAQAIRWQQVIDHLEGAGPGALARESK